MRLKGLGRIIAASVSSHKREIGFGIQCAAHALSIIFTVKATAKSCKAIDYTEAELGRKLTKKEKFKLCWKNYIPVAISEGAGLAGGIVEFTTANKAIAASAAMAEVSDKIIERYEEELSKTHSPEEVRDIRNNATKEVLDSDDYQSKPVVYLKPGEYTFRDGPTGQEFISTIKAMNACEARWTKRCILGDYVTRYDLYTDTLAIRHIPDDASNSYFTADCPPEFDYRPIIEDGELIILVEYDSMTDNAWP
jgi:hypothetical protein